MTKNKRYAIIDIETTGGLSKRDRITEIGIVIHDGDEITDMYETLINPERSIPANITRITGINDDMVKEAPKFYEIAKKIVEMTEDTIFVAHNVRFDYSFIRHEFENLGYTFSKKQLCTVRLSKKVFPGLNSYSLGSLIRHFGIAVTSRHRALEDARATAIIFDKMLKLQSGQDSIKHFINKGLDLTKLPEGITKEQIKELPETAGVYYMHDDGGKIVYIGKSIDIQKRIIQHFGKISRKNERMLQRVRSLSFEETGNELIALLLESDEIKKHNPEINKAQRKKSYPYFIYQYLDLHGYLNFSFDKSSKKNLDGKDVLTFVTSKKTAGSYMRRIVRDLQLCDKYCELGPKDENACFQKNLGNCLGACVFEENPESYNERALIASNYLNTFFDENFFLVLQGRSLSERAIVLIEEGVYQGYGYIEQDHVQYGVEELMEAIHYTKSDTKEASYIIRNYMETNDCELIPF